MNLSSTLGITTLLRNSWGHTIAFSRSDTRSWDSLLALNAIIWGHRAQPKSFANRAATEEFWNNRFLLPCNPWGPRGFHGAAQSTPSRFLFLSRVNFEISPSFSSLLPLSQQHCLGPEKKTNYCKIGNSIQSSKLSLRFVWKSFIHGNCILCLYVKMHLCRFFTKKKFFRLATELDNLFQNPINAVFKI